MRRAALLIFIAAPACGLQVLGKGGPADGGADASAELDAGDDASLDGPEEEGGSIVDAGCSVVVDDPFAVLDPSLWLTTQDSENADYPKVVSIGSENLLALIAQNEKQARGGVWLRSNVPLTGFDLDFNFRTSCSLCGDGFTVSWVAPATPDALDDAVDDKGLGVPSKLAGGAVAVDLYTNGDLGDTDTPNVSLLDLDGTKVPGSYRWIVTTSAKRVDLLNASGGSTLSLRLRGTTMVVRVDGEVVTQGNVQTALAEGRFGFTASTGGRVSGFFVKDVKATFYRCDAPPL